MCISEPQPIIGKFPPFLRGLVRVGCVLGSVWPLNGPRRSPQRPRLVAPQRPRPRAMTGPSCSPAPVCRAAGSRRFFAVMSLRVASWVAFAPSTPHHALLATLVLLHRTVLASEIRVCRVAPTSLRRPRRAGLLPRGRQRRPLGPTAPPCDDPFRGRNVIAAHVLLHRRLVLTPETLVGPPMHVAGPARKRLGHVGAST